MSDATDRFVAAVDATNYIDVVAREIYHEPERGDEPSEAVMGLYRIYAVLALAKGEATTAEDVHDAWSAWTAGMSPEHRSLVPFEYLSEDVQRLDEPFVRAIHAVAERRKAWRA